MLKIRVMPTLLYKDLGLVKGRQFDSNRRVGSVLQAVKVYNLREVDELVFLDIAATLAGRRPDFQLIDDIADECFMPLTVGGGVRTLADVRELLAVGADKVALNTAAVETPELVREASEAFGAQCVVVSIDARRRGGGGYEVFTRCGTRPTGMSPTEHARRVEALGAGEILITSIDRDGTMQGYDTELVRDVSTVVTIPVIASGGAGTYEHMEEVLRTTEAAAVAAASMFHFTERTPREAKLHLRAAGFAVRL
jgi:cyclase